MSDVGKRKQLIVYDFTCRLSDVTPHYFNHKYAADLNFLFTFEVGQLIKLNTSYSVKLSRVEV